jgi:hypothetical protein
VVDGLNLYVYVSNNPLKYIDPAGHVKVYPVNMSLPHDEIDILSPIKGTYQNNNLFYFPEAYERLENIVAFLLHLGFISTRNDGSTTIRVVVFVTEGLGFVIQL